MMVQSCPIAEGMRKSLKELMKQHPKDAERVSKMYEQNGIYCFDLWLRHGDNEKAAGEDLVAVGAGADFPRQAKVL